MTTNDEGQKSKAHSALGPRLASILPIRPIFPPKGAVSEPPRVPRGLKRNVVLERATFETNRTLEYFSEKELRAQIGHDVEFWPVAVLRELIDNALDACEEAAGVAPTIEVTIEEDAFTVRDNGPGLPARVIETSLDLMKRVSTKAYYMSPTRGVMGNALKVVWAAPFVATGRGTVEITSQGQQHIIRVELDRIAQRPDLRHTVSPIAVKAGTAVKVGWMDSARLLRGESRDFYNPPPTAVALVESFAAFNPHATFVLDGTRFARSLDTWAKWSPHQPTSVHWYNAETFRDLIAAYLTTERTGGPGKTVREFVAEFRGLSSTAKQKAVTAGWSGQRLSDFVTHGDIDPGFLQTLLQRMQAASSAPPAKALGSIGEAHFRAWMISHGIAGESIRYHRKAGVDGLPYVCEVAYGVFENDGSRRIVTGLNWSPIIGADPDPTVREAIAEARLDPHDPVMLLIHMARPRFQFVDRGKTRVAL